MNFLFSVVYGHPAPALRNRLWQQLTRVQEEGVLLRVLMGDFNAIAQNSERAGGSDRRIGVNQQFVRWIHTSRLVDLRFMGPKFTWKRGSLYQRLDRGFCSSDWRVAFPEASVTHLARYQSDHGIAERTSLPFRPNDVKNALFAMKPWKAPGVDRFQAGFYQRHWETIGKDICVEEAIHSMRNKPGRIGTMALKVDLEKAYDRISWAFLFDTLNEAKLSAALVDVIMKCVSTSSMQLFWNGNLTESFKPSRGLRLGCPLSPYLFVLCMERLAHGIERAVRADVRTAEAFSNVLDEFCGSSGMNVSTAKTSLFFSKNVDIEKRRIIKNLLGVRVVNDFGQYLGVPLLHRKVSKLTYAHILDKMKAKIANWNTAQLSLASRITLAQAVLCTMPLYAMQTSKFPVGVCAKMGKEIRGFIWGSDKSI
ncbi:hypothetical protein SASPL_143040 [Salvia splendens]|uniref:Reverse transcriptase domain-containing protein n=1 Tax=Salvia splendens TaxID=180675 RepID=A0A8X8Z9D1_SALSN|nr:hypothetical protein SASPL_143040 [Salvia splendens]